MLSLIISNFEAVHQVLYYSTPCPALFRELEAVCVSRDTAHEAAGGAPA